MAVLSNIKNNKFPHVYIKEKNYGTKIRNFKLLKTKAHSYAFTDRVHLGAASYTSGMIIIDLSS